MTTDAPNTLDAIDRALLYHLQRDADLTIQQLADAVGASTSSAQRRIKRLMHSKTASGRRVHVDPRQVGFPLSFVAGLQIERKTEALYAQLRRWMAGCEQVQHCYNVTGEVDFVVILIARSLEDYDLVMERMLKDNPNIRRFNTHAVLQTFKNEALVPV